RRVLGLRWFGDAFALCVVVCVVFFFQAEDGIRDYKVTGVQTCALPLAGFSNFGDSSTDNRPCQSVAGSLPSTGLVQSNLGSRRGIKLPWKYAMSPSASAKIVLFEEFVCRSIICLNDL